MKKIYFVGLHNKPEKMPLCSSTKSGRLIDRIIKEGELNNWQKTNLFNVDYFPTESIEQQRLVSDWYERIQPQNDDIIVLLGAATHKAFRAYGWLDIIKVAHPASKRSHKEMDDYVIDVIKKIKLPTVDEFWKEQTKRRDKAITNNEEGWEKSWEKINNELPKGVNPHAYRLGWLDATHYKEEHFYLKYLESNGVIKEFKEYLNDKEVNLKTHLDQLLCEVSGIFDGWHSDGTHWTEYDEIVRKKIDEFRKKYTYARKNS